MKKKIFVATLVLAMCMQTMFASATSWSLWYTPSAPTNTNQLTTTKGYYTSYSTLKFKESCDYFYFTPEENGRVVHVEYYAYVVESDGTIHRPTTGTYYHYSTQESHNILMNTTAPADSTIYGFFDLVITTSSNATSINGTVGE